MKMMIKEKTGVEIREERPKPKAVDKPVMDSLFEALRNKMTRSQKAL